MQHCTRSRFWVSLRTPGKAFGLGPVVSYPKVSRPITSHGFTFIAVAVDHGDETEMLVLDD